MKKILLGAALSVTGVVLASTATFADLIPPLPPCSVSVDPTLQVSTVIFQCEPYDNPVTGEHYNAIYVGTPKP